MLPHHPMRFSTDDRYLNTTRGTHECSKGLCIRWNWSPEKNRPCECVCPRRVACRRCACRAGKGCHQDAVCDGAATKQSDVLRGLNRSCPKGPPSKAHKNVFCPTPFFLRKLGSRARNPFRRSPSILLQ